MAFLPPEIRIQIWHLVCGIQRDIHLTWAYTSSPRNGFVSVKINNRIPSILQVSRETRYVALRYYRPCIFTTNPVIYVNDQVDSLFLQFPTRSVTYRLGSISARPSRGHTTTISDNIAFFLSSPLSDLLWYGIDECALRSESWLAPTYNNGPSTTAMYATRSGAIRMIIEPRGVRICGAPEGHQALELSVRKAAERISWDDLPGRFGFLDRRNEDVMGEDYIFREGETVFGCIFSY